MFCVCVCVILSTPTQINVRARLSKWFLGKVMFATSKYMYVDRNTTILLHFQEVTNKEPL